MALSNVMATRKLKVVQDLLQQFTGSETTYKKMRQKNKQPTVTLHILRCRAKKILVISIPLNPWLHSWSWRLLSKAPVGGQQKGFLESSLPRLA